MPDFDEIIPKPTWIQHIRHFFDGDDLIYLEILGFDLALYSEVKSLAAKISNKILLTNSEEFPEPARSWSNNRLVNFRRWMQDGFPFGVLSPSQKASYTLKKDVSIRENIADVSSNKQKREKLIRAFNGIITSGEYFEIASIHTDYCAHDELFYPWHRCYIQQLENALRQVDGCHDVTIPYWDFTGPVPDILYEPPFDLYTFPKDVWDYRQGGKTDRFPRNELQTEFEERDVVGLLNAGKAHSIWENFHIHTINSHDEGHFGIGYTMTFPEVSAFDPIFWFYHANWDRIWWKWQQEMQATTLLTFKTTFIGSAKWLNKGLPFYENQPIGSRIPKTSKGTIDLVQCFGVDYKHPESEKEEHSQPRTYGSKVLTNGLRLHNTQKVSIRIKEVDRLQIPGSFTIYLLADEKPLRKRSFFQASTPKKCRTCQKQGKVNFDFIVPLVDIQDCNNLTVRVEVARKDWDDLWFPIALAGNPTLNIRLLLEDM